jgi:hypothetical protein
LPEPDLGVFRFSAKARESVGGALKGAYGLGFVDGAAAGAEAGYVAGHVAGQLEAAAVCGAGCLILNVSLLCFYLFYRATTRQ